MHEMKSENAPYEPTPYNVLERLADSGYIHSRTVLVDYGCGKGRASLFLAYRTGCRVTGIDHDMDLIRAAEENRKSSGIRNVRFSVSKAEDYDPGPADSFYFFNPFTEVILRAVLKRILDSCYGNPRKIRLFFYYPSDETAALLMTEEMLTFADEIDCADLFPGKDSRERILIFEAAPV